MGRLSNELGRIWEWWQSRKAPSGSGRKHHYLKLKGSIYVGIREEIEKFKADHISIEVLNHKLRDQISKKFWKTKVIIPLQDHENARGLFVLGNQDDIDVNLNDRNEYYRVNIIMGRIGGYIFYNNNNGSSWPYKKNGLDIIVRTITRQILTGKNKHKNCGICASAQNELMLVQQG